MCNNKEEFDKEMKKFGIYVPEQDAAWEREGNIFDGIYERKFENLSESLITAHLNNFGFISGHGTCDAENCLCPDGRTFDEDWTIWEIVRKRKINHSIYQFI